MSVFFYCVVIPSGDGQEILSGRLNSANAYDASLAIEMLHPDALEIRVRRERVLNVV